MARLCIIAWNTLIVLYDPHLLDSCSPYKRVDSLFDPFFLCSCRFSNHSSPRVIHAAGKCRLRQYQANRRVLKVASRALFLTLSASANLFYQNWPIVINNNKLNYFFLSFFYVGMVMSWTQATVTCSAYVKQYDVSWTKSKNECQGPTAIDCFFSD